MKLICPCRNDPCEGEICGGTIDEFKKNKCFQALRKDLAGDKDWIKWLGYVRRPSEPPRAEADLQRKGGASSRTTTKMERMNAAQVKRGWCGTSESHGISITTEVPDEIKRTTPPDIPDCCDQCVRNSCENFYVYETPQECPYYPEEK